MKKIERVLLIGHGAVGAAYASKFYDKNPHVLSVVADEKRRVLLNEGLIINNKAYNFNTVSPEEQGEPADLIIVAVKFHHLEQAIKDIKNFVGPDTIILSLLNGISSEEIIGQAYGMDRVLYGMCMAIDAVREGNTIEFSSQGKIHFGEANNTTLSPKVQAVKELFDEYDIAYVIPENMIKTLWWKFMINVGINQCSAVLDAKYGVFLQVKEAGELMESAMREVVEISKKNGVHLEERLIAEFYQVIKTLSPESKTSMHQDMDAGRKTEVEMLGGTVCQLGKEYGVPTPVNETLFRIIRTMEALKSIHVTSV